MHSIYLDTQNFLKVLLQKDVSFPIHFLQTSYKKLAPIVTFCDTFPSRNMEDTKRENQ